jgi:hypothetical protein
VLGCVWAARRGRNSRRVGNAQAQGIFVAELGVLARHFRVDALGAA